MKLHYDQIRNLIPSQSYWNYFHSYVEGEWGEKFPGDSAGLDFNKLFLNKSAYLSTSLKRTRRISNRPDIISISI